MNNLPIKNISFYHFFNPTIDLQETKGLLRARMLELGIRGSILLAEEGINASLSGASKEMDLFLSFLFETIHITSPDIKISHSKKITFKRSLVKVKPFIVHPPGMTAIDLKKNAAPHLSPKELHQWIKEGKKMILLDTRNDYEYEIGRFKDSLHLGTAHFADFEKDLSKAPEEWKSTTVVTFCTGGIRCEKAAPLMVKKGFHQVYQLDGGILNYFKEVGQGYFEGNCFVFDQRVALNENLTPSESQAS